MSARVFFVVLLAIPALFACRGSEDVDARAQVRATSELHPAEAKPCHWDCQPCPADAPCSQECVAQGSCASACGVYLQCDPGYGWDDTRCACIPE